MKSLIAEIVPPESVSAKRQRKVTVKRYINLKDVFIQLMLHSDKFYNFL